MFEFLFRERVDFFTDGEVVLADTGVIGSGVLGSLGAGGSRQKRIEFSVAFRSAIYSSMNIAPQRYVIDRVSLHFLVRPCGQNETVLRIETHAPISSGDEMR